MCCLCCWSDAKGRNDGMYLGHKNDDTRRMMLSLSYGGLELATPPPTKRLCMVVGVRSLKSLAILHSESVLHSGGGSFRKGAIVVNAAAPQWISKAGRSLSRVDAKHRRAKEETDYIASHLNLKT